MDPIKIGCASVTVLEKNFIRTVYCDGCLINSKHLEEIREVYTDIYDSEDLSGLRLLVVFEGDIDISQDLTERYLNGRIRKKVGEALVAENPTTREYLRAAGAIMNKTHPVEVFPTEEDATNWLNSL